MNDLDQTPVTWPHGGVIGANGLTPNPRRDWLKIGKHYNEDAAKKAVMSGYIKALEWHPLPIESLPMAPGMAIKELIREFRIPKVSQVAWNVVAFNRYGLIGIEGNYRNGRARIYALDRGSDLVPVVVEFWPVTP